MIEQELGKKGLYRLTAVGLSDYRGGIRCYVCTCTVFKNDYWNLWDIDGKEFNTIDEINEEVKRLLEGKIA